MILAIDPGINGALAWYSGQVLTVRDMPTYTRKAGARQTDRRFIDEEILVDWITNTNRNWLLVEQVGGIPGQSAHAAFMFGRGVGVIVGAAHANGLRIEEVHPSQWKSALKVPADKRLARERASELMPAYSNLWTRAKDDGRAEAAMLAYYGWQVKGDLT